MVDPDNRRPVDYSMRQELLKELQSWNPGKHCEPGCQARSLLDHMEDGRVKLYLLWKALVCRREQIKLFQQGRYIPLAGHGPGAAHLCAFAREWEGNVAVVVVPRLCATLLGDKKQSPVGEEVWGDTGLDMPAELNAGSFRNIFTNEVIRSQSGAERPALQVSAVLRNFPVALLLSSPTIRTVR
jgi:(1->4)-alpha-D-glucan 1-alpha-D-glucosylmutase